MKNHWNIKLCHFITGCSLGADWWGNTDICTARILARVLHNDLAKFHMTWAGRSENKSAFEELELKNVVIGWFIAC